MTFTTSRVLPVIGLLAGIALLTPAPPLQRRRQPPPMRRPLACWAE